MTARVTPSTFLQLQQPDAVLAAIIGDEPVTRPQITVKLWKYIKTNQLQDPDNRRQINADNALKWLFDGKDSCTMFELPGFVNRHITPIARED